MEIHVHHELAGGPVLSSHRARRFAARTALAISWTASWAAPAYAFDLEVPHGTPSVVGESHTFRAEVTGATGDVTFTWRFGDAGEPIEGGAEMATVFDTAGHHSVDVVATDSTGATGSAFFRHLAHYPLTPARPAHSSPIIYDSARNRIYTVNPDNDTVAVIDPDALIKLGEFFVYENPESLALTPEGKLWVLHKEDYAMAVVDPDQLVIERGFRLPYASQPIALAQSPTGDAAYVSLMALGKLLKLHPTTGDVLGEVEVGGRPRGVAVSHDGRDVYVTRFISSDTGGEVVKVAAADMTVSARITLPVDTETIDTDLQARGVPNYLFSVVLTPDGRQAWVPGKQDNILRGLLRDGQPLTHDTTVRPLTSIIDLGSGVELFESRIDLDDRSMPVHAEFTPYGDFAILSLAGSKRIEIRDVYRPQHVFSAIGGAGVFPRATVLAPNGRLFVQATLSRSVLAYDMSSLLKEYDAATPPLLAEIPTVTYETLPPQVLEGKKLFHDAEDTRMAFEGYLSCGACHFEGLDDGRVYDFSSIGEGLRNTVAVLGRPGSAQGRLNWSGNFDELQDLEHTIRDLFRGTGFLPDAVMNEGTRGDPLGDPKAGLSPELDALAAYVASLDRVNPSPYKNPDGTLTPDGEAGKQVFLRLGCDFCHAGPAFTDSDRGSLHDVGTLTPLTGTRAGEPLFGIDTPTLLGVWETPPYLHDGSAPTLRDVITTKNPDDLHGFVSILTPTEIDQLVAYMLQIDGDPPPRRLPFEPPDPGSSTTSSTTGGGTSTGGASSTTGTLDGSNTTSAPSVNDGDADDDGCSCRLARPTPSPARNAFVLLLTGLVAGGTWRRRLRRGSSS